MKETQLWVVVDNSTKKALYGRTMKTLRFLSKEEADNFGSQICTSWTSIQINL